MVSAFVAAPVAPVAAAAAAAARLTCLMMGTTIEMVLLDGFGGGGGLFLRIDRANRRFSSKLDLGHN